MTEKQVIELLNQEYNLNLEQESAIFSDFDASGPQHIVEVKCRNTYYKTKLIEAYKMYKLIHFAATQNKKPVYAVQDPSGVYVYRLDKVADKGVKVTKQQLPKSTMFNKDQCIDKFVIQLEETSAEVVIALDKANKNQ
jgi:hypothetical protein